MTRTAGRLLTLIQLLQRRPNQKAGDLAEELGVSVRTLHRYLAQLEEMGLPLYSERGPYGGFALVRGYRLPPLVFSPEEATALALGAGAVADLWGPLYRDAAAGALAKLENVLPDEQRAEAAWARRSLVASGLRRPVLDSATHWLAPLRRAAREQRQVWLRYRAGSGAGPSERVLDPYLLGLRGGWWYVAGFCHLRQAMRSFRLDRIEALEVREDRFELRPGVDARATFEAETQAQAGFVARLRFNADAADLARANRAMWNELHDLPDGRVEVLLHAPDLQWAGSICLSFGPLLEVLDPPELRQVLRDWASAVASLYAKETPHA